MERIFRWRSLLILMLFFFAVGVTQALTPPQIPEPPQPPNPPERPTYRVIIKFKDSVSTTDRSQFFFRYNLSQPEPLKQPGVFSAQLNKGNAPEFVASLESNDQVEYIEPDAIATKVEVPNDPMTTDQWGLGKIRAFDAWDTTHGSDSVDIAILDTGVDGSHPDVGAKIASRANFTGVADGDIDGHGTHVAGIAAAVTNNGLGVAGTSFTSRIMSVKVLDDNGSGYYSWIANGIYWAADNGAEVINMSLGGTSPSITLQNAVTYASNKGVVIVAAAGNSNRSRALYPAYYTSVIAVAATDQADKKAKFSNYGSWVDVAAPGVSILSAHQGGYDYLSGTSMATPFVAGLAALVKGYNPGWSNTQVRSKIESTADSISGTGTYWAYGRINACKAVDCTTDSGETLPTPTPTPREDSGQAPTPTPSPTPSLTPTPTPISPTGEPTPTPTPTPSNKPWWCIYVPTHPWCQ